MIKPDLPVQAIVPDLKAHLNDRTNAILIAPPGAGKTTTIALELLHESWCRGGIILLSPRRVAARASAERMAQLLGEKAGETVGYLTRLDSKQSKHTRIWVMTEAIFVSTILKNPELSHVSAVLFDEAHERHLDSDLGLALAIECQQVLRDDLRIVVMSATLDGQRFSGLLNDAKVLESEGKSYPISYRWLGARPELRLDEAMALAIAQAWRDSASEGLWGSILAFLPGVSEIRRTEERLREKIPDALIYPLHGQCDPADQRKAIKADPSGQRRIVLATAIAETSLTLDGVSTVVDSGLSRRAEFDAQAGFSRLVTRPSSQASAAQRAGRSGRQGPGTVYRLWEEASHAGRASFDPPEILIADITAMLLTLAQWGTNELADLAWLDVPNSVVVQQARERLYSLGALDAEHRITEHGRQMAQLPMSPALAHMLLFSAQYGAEGDAASLALLLQERGLGGPSEDLQIRLERWNMDRGPRASSARNLAAAWAKRASTLVKGQATTRTLPLGILLAEAYPDNIARKRSAQSEDWLSSGGRGLRLPETSSLSREQWLAVGDAQGDPRGARITSAIALDEEDIQRWLGHRLQKRSSYKWLGSERRVEAILEQKIGSIAIAKGPNSDPDLEEIRAFLLAQIRKEGLEIVVLGNAADNFLKRARFAGIEALREDVLLEDLESWLAPYLKRRLEGLDTHSILQALKNRLDWNAQQAMEKLVPAQFHSPIQSSHMIDYDDEVGPSVELRVQALFGLDVHPTYGQPPQPLVLHLTSPAGRPIQTTKDLPNFWRGSWRDVVRDMKGRYPRHRWPDEPWNEKPGLKTRKAFEASNR